MRAESHLALVNFNVVITLTTALFLLMEIMDIKAFGQLVLEFRKSKGLDQDELAELIGYSDKTLRTIEKGKLVSNKSYLKTANYMGYNANIMISLEKNGK